MSKRKPTALSSFFDSEEFTQPLTKVDDILEMNITVHDVEFRAGKFGPYALFNVTIEETGLEAKVTSGALAIMQMLKKADASRQFPFRCKITTANSMYKPIDADDEVS